MLHTKAVPMRRSFFQLLPAFSRVGKKESFWFLEFDMVTLGGCNMQNGRAIEKWNSAVIASAPDKVDCVCDFMLSLNGWPIFGPKLQNIISHHFPNSVQFLLFNAPFHIENKAGGKLAVGQILRSTDGIDREHSKVDNDDWTPRENGTYRLQYPVHLRYDSISGEAIFRTLFNSGPIYVRDDFRAICEREQVSGMRFDSNVPVH